jgi:tetratricopeptide (TPR) repeat protein
MHHHLSPPRLTPPPEPLSAALAAFDLKRQRHFELAAKAFRQLGNLYQAGWCMALLGSPEDAIDDWSLLLHRYPRHWCVHAFGLIKGTLAMAPEFMGIRLYLEMDLWSILHAKRLDYAENMTYFADVLQAEHLEAPKFLAKPWLLSGYTDQAYTLLMQGLTALPHDPEAYYLLGWVHYARQDMAQSRLMWQEALMINPQYWPATAALIDLNLNDENLNVANLGTEETSANRLASWLPDLWSAAGVAVAERPAPALKTVDL